MLEMWNPPGFMVELIKNTMVLVLWGHLAYFQLGAIFLYDAIRQSIINLFTEHLSFDRSAK